MNVSQFLGYKSNIISVDFKTESKLCAVDLNWRVNKFSSHYVGCPARNKTYVTDISNKSNTNKVYWE